MDQGLIAKAGEIVAGLQAEHGEPALARVREFLAITMGQKPRPETDPLQKPSLFYFPGLTAKAWHDPADYPWARALEAECRAMRNEVLVRAAGEGALTPAGEPVPEVVHRALAQLPWDHLNLHEDDNASRFPDLTRRLRATFRARFGEPVQFKLLLFRPGARFGPRYTDNNHQLTFRLGLYGHGGQVKTGAETRTWREGQCLVCDDSFLHETWHDGSGDPRIVLAGRIWHPDLTDVEVTAIIALARAMAAAAGGGRESQWKAKLDQVRSG